MLKSIALIFALLISSSAFSQVWVDTNTWSPEWEARFADWVHHDWAVDFFSRQYLANGQSNPYYGLRTDCAETVYSMRIVFSYENKLPFAVLDPTTLQGLITNRMGRWNTLGNDTDRIRHFLMFMYDTISTRSLPNDTFPVPISREWVHSGGLMRTNEVNHHSWTIQEMLPIGVPHLIFNSTVGKFSGSMLQQRTSWPNPDWVFQGNFSPSGNAGLRYWRPIDSLLKPLWQTPNYSEEQYHIPLDRWNDVVQKKLAVANESNQQMISRLEDNICAGIKGRVKDVSDALRFLRTQPAGQCLSAADFDTYSTPSRDHRLFDDIVALRRAYKKILNNNQMPSLTTESQVQLAKIFPFIRSSAQDETARMPRTAIDRNSLCVTEYGSGRTLDLAEAKRRFFLGAISNNPNDSIEYRWGELAGPSPQATSCPSWGGWSPDLGKAN